MQQIYLFTLSFIVMLSSALSAQNVGIGTANPSQKLDVQGGLVVDNLNDGGTSALWVTRHGAESGLKDFQKLENALEKVLQINGMYYNWKADEYPEMQLSDKKQLGLIAQEIQKVLPEIVDEDEDGYLSVEYGHLTPLLIEAVKELSDELSESRKEQLTMAENNKCEIEKLKDELSLLRSQTKRMDNLEKEISYIREQISMSADVK
ncbi:MAG: tail fiber domain-containing protein [Chitinophagales bacterium]